FGTLLLLDKAGIVLQPFLDIPAANVLNLCIESLVILLKHFDVFSVPGYKLSNLIGYKYILCQENCFISLVHPSKQEYVLGFCGKLGNIIDTFFFCFCNIHFSDDP
ncbi:hypothetical protein ACJX0J_006839, partial [Zea mays]